MGRIEDQIKALKERGEKALVVYLTAGYPGLEATREMIIVLDGAGVDIVELGVPFSDPVADGYIKVQAAAGGAQVWSNLDPVSPGAGWWLVSNLDGVSASSLHVHGAFITG